ncbi:MAG TPA: carboxypeptidase regulatory-like domain-containing protein [Thermoanaerobaculia bacterium]|nr:carboxypeptidase regulatory-like domain-containing protein [Thermoanaerobaculia bacterium]
MRRWGIAVLTFVSALTVFAQSTTAVLVGRVTSNTVALPGVIVTITSPALQGARTVETSVNGTYSFAAVPPGNYRVAFAMSGLQTVVRSAELQLAETTRVDADLQAVLNEQIEVTPAPLAGIETQQVSSNFSQEFVNILPIGRAILDITRLAAGVQDAGPGRRLMIHGAHSVDNLYLVNGAVVTEARRNQPQNLFIEDAIQETTVLTAGISAEYGRFTGGVISVITKQGGNTLSGSVRDTLSSDAWTAQTPGEPEHLDKLNHDFEGTVGGRVLRDRLWFFGAGRYAERRERRETAITEFPYITGSDERRLEAKITASLADNHTFVASYLDVESLTLNNDTGTPGDLRTLYDTELPHSLLAGHYSVVLTNAAVVEAQYTRKEYTLSGGGPGTDRIRGTQVQDFVNGVFSWAPSFCSDCRDTYRDNREALIKATLFLSSPRWGSHSIVAGFNDFHEYDLDDSRQSPSDFVVTSANRYEDGQLWLTMIPGESSIEWYPIPIPSRGDDFGTRSAYVNDRIDVGSRWTFNAGVRFDRAVGRDQGGSVQARDTRWSPRLAAIWDLGGDRRNRVSASFGRYAAKVDQFVAKVATPAGEPATYSWIYDGPELNTGGELLPTEEVLRRVFEWFDSVGGTENIDLLAFYEPPIGFEVQDQLRAPVMDEYVLGYGRQFGSAAYLRADLIRRRWHDFYTLRATEDLGHVTDPLGTAADRVIIENSDDGLRREYDGITLQGTWRRGGFTTGGNYTLSRLRGNVEQETAGAGTTAIQSPVAYYPEYTGFANFAPMGYLSGDERHRGNLWAAYQWNTRLGAFAASLLQTYHSGRRYQVRSTVDVRPYVTNPGYLAPLTLPQYFFTPRGGLQLDDISSTSLGLNYSRVLGVVETFLEADIVNVFNAQGVEVGVGQNVRTSRTDRNLAPFNPYTTTPVECPRGTPTSSAECRGKTHFQLQPNFGQPTSKDSYQQPRTYRVSVGVRF